MALVAELPCAIRKLRCCGRTTVHHRTPGASYGTPGRRSTDFHTIPLCVAHHLNGPESITHLSGRGWERYHGVSQADLVESTRQSVINNLLAYSMQGREHPKELLVHLTK
jgi:hypothetical protein